MAFCVQLVRLFDERTDHIRLSPCHHLALDETKHTLQHGMLHGIRLDWLTPFGQLRSVDTSMSPKAVIASVRGIGVAVIVSTSGFIPLRRKMLR